MNEPQRIRSPLVDEVLTGGNQQLQLLAARGLLPLPPEQVTALQVTLASSADPMVAREARGALAAIAPQAAVAFLETHASGEELTYFARHGAHPLIQEAILRRREVPRELLEELAVRLPPDQQELLLLRQDAIVEHPAILDTLSLNPVLTPYARRRISEYRQHLLPRAVTHEEAEPEFAEPELPELLEGEATDAELAAALASAQNLPAEGEVDDESGLSESQVRQMPLPVRLRLSRGASRSLRQILVRDNNALVALSVIANNPLSDQEVEGIARNRAVLEDVLTAISRRREWMRKYPIILALVGNPRTPIATAVKLMPMMAVRDLRNLAKDKNISETVRRAANRLYKIKQV